jgi:hypothetical protein
VCRRHNTTGFFHKFVSFGCIQADVSIEGVYVCVCVVTDESRPIFYNL